MVRETKHVFNDGNNRKSSKPICQKWKVVTCFSVFFFYVKYLVTCDAIFNSRTNPSLLRVDYFCFAMKVVIVPLCALLANASPLKNEKNQFKTILLRRRYHPLFIYHYSRSLVFHPEPVLCMGLWPVPYVFQPCFWHYNKEWLRSTVAPCARHNRPCGVETYFLYSYITFKRMLKTPSTVTIGGLYLRTIR